MKSKIAILALVGLTAGAFGTIGTRILAEPDTQVTNDTVQAAPLLSAEKGKSGRDACKALARAVSGGTMSDARLKRLLNRHRDCNAVIVDSKTPGVAGSTSPRVITIPSTDRSTITQAASSTAVSQATGYEDDEYEDEDDGYEDEGHEDEHESEDEED
jgi:hypothetical protein